MNSRGKREKGEARETEKSPATRMHRARKSQGKRQRVLVVSRKKGFAGNKNREKGEERRE
jgi:hypothetical protein